MVSRLLSPSRPCHDMLQLCFLVHPFKFVICVLCKTMRHRLRCSKTDFEHAFLAGPTLFPCEWFVSVCVSCCTGQAASSAAALLLRPHVRSGPKMIRKSCSDLLNPHFFSACRRVSEGSKKRDLWRSAALAPHVIVTSRDTRHGVWIRSIQ